MSNTVQLTVVTLKQYHEPFNASMLVMQSTTHFTIISLLGSYSELCTPLELSKLDQYLLRSIRYWLKKHTY